MALRHREMLLLGNVTDRFARADAQMQHANPYRVSLRDLYGISHAVGQFWRIPGCIFIVLLAVICTVRAAPSRFRRAFDLESLAREQARIFRAGATFLGRKLNLVAPAEGAPLPADYALTPDEWIERFGCDAKGVFDESHAWHALWRQLGPRWTGPGSASPVVKLLFVAFALHLSERREDAIELLGAVSSALAPVEGQKMDVAEPPTPPGDLIAYATKLLRDPEAFGEARKVTAAHAYTAPALMTLLNAARRKHGVLAPAQFAWLKLLDRSLWYALHSLGFETEGIGRYLHPNPRVEALGARDHWAVECAARAPVIEPDLTRAMRTLRRHARARASASWLLCGARHQGGGEQRR
jgi:intracellular multiplication protein IcmP